MTRLLSNNLYKSRWIVSNQNNDKRVIDSNELVIKKIEEERKRQEQKRKLLQPDLQTDFEEGLQAKQVGALFDDIEEQTEYVMEKDLAEKELESQPKVVQPEPKVYTGPSPEELVEKAKQEIAFMKSQAEEEINQRKAEELEKAKEAGYAEGKKKAEMELRQKQNQLVEKEKELTSFYEEQLHNMETKLVDTLTDVYEHVLGTVLEDYAPIVLHVLDHAMHEAEDVKNFMIHVSKTEANMVKSNKDKLSKNLSNQIEIEIIEDMTLSPGEAYIETEGEIFDCSIDLQLDNLGRQIKALAYQANTK